MGNNYFINLPPTAGGGDLTAAYLLVSGSDPSSALAGFQRTIVAQGVITLLDQGPGLNLIVSASGIPGVQGPSGSNGTNGTNGANGGADLSASYVVMALTGSLPNDRKLTAGGGIVISDGGAGGNVVISNSGLVLTGSIFGNTTGAIGTVSGNTVITTQSVLFVSTSAGSMNLTLPPSTLGRTIMFKDVSGQANANPFTVFPVANNTIDTASASYVYNINFGVLKLIGDGGGWYTW